MNVTLSSVLDPKLLGATRGLTLAARQLVSGVLPGLHASRRPGVAREFSQFRAYQPGDEPRHIDWKLFARSDRHYVRESEVETAVTVRLILDATASMRHADSAGPGEGVRKFDVARLLAAALAFLAQAQGDQPALHAVIDGRIVSAPSGGHRQPLERIVRTLAALEPAGRWPVDDRALSLAVAAGTRPGLGAAMVREIVVVLTDGHEHGREIRAALAPLRTRGHELVLFHLLGRDEIDFPFRGPVRFEDWETGETFETDAGAARAAWLEGQARQLAVWRRDWEGDGRFEYAQFRLDEPPERALRAYLKKRQLMAPSSRK
jgi:uncharacterized protein (DUF58 family)